MLILHNSSLGIAWERRRMISQGLAGDTHDGLYTPDVPSLAIAC